ncbi:MAG: hypothetical protein NT001_01825 [Candidatus Woesearchaeota archaeon]|nr:hypothetical protein [Candidatus Woesearchaeota archaeon]
MEFRLSSNNTLAILLLLVVAISLGGTLVSLNRLKGLEAASPVTGMALYTATAGVNITITSTTAINFTTNYVNFGTGTVNGTCGYCNMYTNNHSVANFSSCCNGFANTASASSGFILENIGNMNVSIGMNSTNNAVTFIGGTTSPGPQFRMKVTENETYSCANVTYGPASGLNATWNNTFGDVPTTETEICARLRPDASMDELRIDINMTIPDNSMTGLRTDTLSATATSRTD